MANRIFKKQQGTLTNGVVKLFGTVTTGNAGVIASQQCDGFSVARTGAGVYTVTLQDKYNSLLAVSMSMIGVGSASIYLSNVDVAGAASFVLNCLIGGVAADVPNGAILLIAVTLKNASFKG